MLIGAAVALAVLVGCFPAVDTRTKGTMPPPRPNGDVDERDAPDFIAAWNRDGTAIAGWIPKDYLLSPELAGRDVQPVYGDDLKTLVGHMVADRGFVPIGTDPLSVPEFPAVAGPSGAPVP